MADERGCRYDVYWGDLDFFFFSPNEHPGLFSYSELQTTSKENTLFWLIAARSAIPSINTLHLGQMGRGEWSRVFHSARHAGLIQLSSLNQWHTIAGYFSNVNTSVRITAVYFREFEMKWQFHSLFLNTFLMEVKQEENFVVVFSLSEQMIVNQVSMRPPMSNRRMMVKLLKKTIISDSLFCKWHSLSRRTLAVILPCVSDLRTAQPKDKCSWTKSQGPVVRSASTR